MFVAVTDVSSVTAQTVISRADAYRLATTHSPRTGVARADSAAAAASVNLAHQFENPTFSASYSKSEPQSHFSLDIPFDLPGARAPRIAAARSTLSAATLRSQYGRASLELDVDTTYTRAQADEARAALSARTARDADSLLIIARVRRDAGDASDLDVELALVFAGQARNSAINDSLAAANSVVLLQALIGLRPDSASITLGEHITLTDTGVANGAAPQGSVLLPVVGARSSSTPTFVVAAAEREAEAANYRVLVEQRRKIAAPSLSVGFESVGPSSPGILPTVGVAIPLPLFNRNSASVQVAQAELLRARAQLALVKLEQSAALNSAERNAAALRARLLRSQQLVVSANRIAALSLIQYREGAAPLASVLDAQRSARETLSQYVDDVSASRVAESVLRFLSLSSVTSPQ